MSINLQDPEIQELQRQGELCPQCGTYKRGEDGRCVDCFAMWPEDGSAYDDTHCRRCGKDHIWHGRDERQRVCDECRFSG